LETLFFIFGNKLIMSWWLRVNRCYRVTCYRGKNIYVLTYTHFEKNSSVVDFATKTIICNISAPVRGSPLVVIPCYPYD
jgi:hypothetical protein